VQQKQLDIATFADEANTLIISALQHAAEATLGRVSPPKSNQNKDQEEQEEQDEKDKRPTSYSSTHPEVKLLQTQAQQTKNELQKAREDKAPLIDLKSLDDSYVDKKNAMLKKQKEVKQASLTQRVFQEPAAEVSSNPSNLEKMWD
jgi:carboxylesterase type B